MSAAALVSVIIPVFNGERFLAEAIESVLAQDYAPLELIVVDDGSTDGTPAIIARYLPAHCLRQANHGHAAAKNAGLAAAQGELIAFLDADDVWRRGKLAAQAAALRENPALAFVTCHCRLFRAPGADWPAWVKPEFYDQPQPAHLPSALLARRSAFERLGAFDPSFAHSDDSDWFMRARDAGLPGQMMPEVLYDRRVHAANMSWDLSGISAAGLRALRASIQRKRAARGRGSAPGA
jgi:glycosyltransferase involved in cell wall biosynthesis